MRLAVLLIAVFVVVVLVFAFAHFGWLGLIDAAFAIASLGVLFVVCCFLARFRS